MTNTDTYNAMKFNFENFSVKSRYKGIHFCENHTVALARKTEKPNTELTLSKKGRQLTSKISE